MYVSIYMYLDPPCNRRREHILPRDRCAWILSLGQRVRSLRIHRQRTDTSPTALVSSAFLLSVLLKVQ